VTFQDSINVGPKPSGDLAVVLIYLFATFGLVALFWMGRSTPSDKRSSTANSRDVNSRRPRGDRQHGRAAYSLPAINCSISAARLRAGHRVGGRLDTLLATFSRAAVPRVRTFRRTCHDHCCSTSAGLGPGVRCSVVLVAVG